MNSSVSRKRSFGRIAITVVLVFCLLAILAFGAIVYCNAVEVQTARDDRSLVQAALTTRLLASDRVGAIEIRNDSVGDVLVLSEQGDSGVFETRLYACDGALMEAYVPAGTPFDASDGEAIGSTDVFEVKREGSLITLRDDYGTQYFDIRAEAGDGI